MTIFQQAEQLKYSMELPFGSKESIMLLDGTKYLTGSDYSPEFLNTPVEDLESMQGEEKKMRLTDAKFTWQDLHGHINNEGELEV